MQRVEDEKRRIELFREVAHYELHQLDNQRVAATLDVLADYLERKLDLYGYPWWHPYTWMYMFDPSAKYLYRAIDWGSVRKAMLRYRERSPQAKPDVALA